MQLKRGVSLRRCFTFKDTPMCHNLIMNRVTKMNRVTGKQTQLCTRFSEPPNHLCAINSSRHFPSERPRSARQAGNTTERSPVGNELHQKNRQRGARHVYSHMHLAQTDAPPVKCLSTLVPERPQEAAVSQELSSATTPGLAGARVPYIKLAISPSDASFRFHCVGVAAVVQILVLLAMKKTK